jgi:anaerobic selenocysteine-containing dehydrogenase
VSTLPRQQVAAFTGLETDTIISVARDIGTTKVTIPGALIGVERLYSGATMYRLLSIILALTGSQKLLGGGFVRSLGVWSEQRDVDISAVGSMADQLVPDERNHRSFDQPRLVRPSPRSTARSAFCSRGTTTRC